MGLAHGPFPKSPKSLKPLTPTPVFIQGLLLDDLGVWAGASAQVHPHHLSRCQAGGEDEYRQSDVSNARSIGQIWPKKGECGQRSNGKNQSRTHQQH